MAANFKYDVFIAYAGPDVEYAQQLDTLLSTIGNKIFLATNLPSGTFWEEEILAAQSDSLLTAVLLSSSTSKAWFQKEEIQTAIRLAREKGHRILPIYLAGESPQAPLLQIEGIFLEKERSLLRVALRIEEAIANARLQEDWQSDIDAATIVIVTGCHHLPELFDRPPAYQLKQAIDQAGAKASRSFLRSIVMGDIWFNERSGHSDHPNVISLGSPNSNYLTQKIIDNCNIVKTGDRWRILRGGDRWALYGDLAQHTRAAAIWFQENKLKPFLDELWTQR
jgi:hypothetical protein